MMCVPGTVCNMDKKGRSVLDFKQVFRFVITAVLISPPTHATTYGAN